jgi:hypothetical protein
MSRATNSPARSPAAPSLVGPPVRSDSRGHFLGDAGAAPDLRADSRTGYRSEAGCRHIGHRGGPPREANGSSAWKPWRSYSRLLRVVVVSK